MSAKDVIDIYRSRFQIEFLFRDAKQFTELCHCQSRNIEALYFAFNLSLSAINVARAFGKQNDLNLSIADYKLLFLQCVADWKIFINVREDTEHA